ncbi:hypothetical protein [Taylorella equigenitalis]|uniref:Transmembrane protein n=3 Tax=Taylorella equigenitalis TaxID=29575 RepID=A0A654KHF6_TAYEM|nr:hypothetical protein [Taylorella equigenitalis]ADU91861.1 hypothetical protein TEQUI_0930 [Taylorella equigenitalis MCE9]AFN35426.1 hypothetical protein KUI_0332 [Taylorella equigenitalis ATCC 35865]ASY30083.1 hypothetical protein B9Z30_01530 [Taylorella equigenitalis]ASY37388.1 hypothetical protein CA605_01485 [Taylorella equigenitalis]ASY38854.1 hypothetical protein CA604_01640 [Taylorella equigenitalis]
MDLILSIIRGIFIFGVTILGFIFAFFLISTAFLVGGAMFLTNKLSGRSFSFGDYVKRTQKKAAKTQQDFAEKFRHPSYSRRKPQEITDVDFVETNNK